jgi:nitrogen fixation/metabolism regulation signal transduction histidine kinase
MAFKLLIYILIVVIASAVISHKIAGPVYKFEKTCEKISEGDLTQRVFLRKGDSLIELQSAFNNMIEKLHSVIKINEDLKKELKEKNIGIEKIELADRKIKETMPDFKI